MSAHPGLRTSVLRNHCPHCDHATDRVTAVDAGRGPEGGDLSICVACGEWAVFADDLMLRKPTDDEFIEIGQDATCRRARAAWVRAFEPPPMPPASPGPDA